MELYEREFLLSKILIGSSVIEINSGEYIYVNPLTVKQNFFAQRVYKRVYEEALLSGALTRKERLNLMEREGVWSEEKESQLGKNKKLIENRKIDLLENFLRPKTREKIREDIRSLERAQMLLYSTKHESDHLDCEGIATYARWNWIIENTTTYEDGTPYEFTQRSIKFVLTEHQKCQSIDVDDLREVAREEPWRGIWSVSKDAAVIFSRKPAELSELQMSLIGWSKLYDSVNEAHESPRNEVIKDDDALDGWLAKQRKEREKQQGQQNLGEKHSSADEVFVIARSKEEIEEISSLNDPHSKGVKRERMARLKNKADHSGRGLEYHKFTDRKQKAMIEANNAGMSK